MGSAFVLHGLWRGDARLALWVETAEGTAEEAGPPPAHPAAGPPALLARLLAGAGPGLEWLAGRARPGRVRLLLPAVAGRPVPSPESGGPRAGGAAGLRPWRVPCLVFGPADAAQLLGALAPPPGGAVLATELSRTEPVEVPYGASLRWLTEAHDLAYRLVGAGQVLPALDTASDGSPTARWRPAPGGPWRRAVAALTDRVPPVCRAEWDPAAHPAGRSGAAVTGELLAALTDAEARAALAGLALAPPPRRRARAAAPGALATATGHWLAALTTPDGRIAGEARDGLAALTARLAAWHATDGAAAAGPVRLCLRLAEPEGQLAGPDDWRLHLLLHPADEPSLLVEAERLWQGGAALAALGARLDDPRGTFLDELDRAARVWPGLRPALREARPAGLPLTRDGALRFLRDGAPALLAAGCTVQLPAWWRRPARIGVTLAVRAPAARPAGPGRVGEDAVQAFRWEAALDGEPLTERDLRELAAARLPLVRRHGRWVVVDQRQVAAALELLTRRGEGTATAVEVLRTVYAPVPEVAGLPVTGVRAEGALERFLAGPGGDGGAPPVAVPAWFGAELRPHQREGVAWLAGLSRLGIGAVLADDMGLGKTVQVLALLAAESEAGAAAGTQGATLVVCPLSLLGTWRREAARFAPRLRVRTHHGPGRAAGAAVSGLADGADLVLTTYGTAVRDAAALAAVTWRRLVADEAQALKNPAADRARALRALPARHRVALTGTPVENRLADLHAVLDFANPGLFGSAEAFRERFAVPIEVNGSADAARTLRRLTGPFLLRRRKDDPGVLPGLPGKQESTVLCGLTAEQAGLYQAVVADLLGRAGRAAGEERHGLILAALTRLKQICNHPAHYLGDGSRLAGRSGKLDRLERLLDGVVADGEKALCFTQFAAFGALLRGHLAARFGGEVPFLHGGTGPRARQEMVDRFQDPDGPRVFVLTLGAGGLGLTLTAARHVVHVDRWWNPAVAAQATDRAHRIGQAADVRVHRLVCRGTVEERVEAMAVAKQGLAETVTGPPAALGDLSAEELRALVALSAEAAA